MREYVSREKKTTTGFSIPSLKHPIPGFGLKSSAISRQAVSGIQPLHKPVTHDISRIPLRSQAKLSISQPGDIYEQEADNVAQQVMQRMAQPVNSKSIQREALSQEDEELQMKPLASSITPLVQREASPEEDEELQMKSLDNSTLQREASPEEDEELQMKSLDNRTLQREASPEEDEELQMKSLDNRTLQREALPEEEEELQMKSMVQRQGEAGMDAAPDLEASINQARGGGQTMANNIREPMEQAFGADFSGVKVHTDGQSDQLNRSIQARAFTTGQDVFFRSGEYNPGSRGGQELLAHELTHVVQQNSSKLMRQIEKQRNLPKTFPAYRLTQSESPIISQQKIQVRHLGGNNLIQLVRGDFDDTTKDDYIIYEVVERATDNVVYIGQTLSSVGTSARFNQHLKKKNWSKQTHKILQLEKGNWTQFEACAFEQWHMENQGGLAFLPDNTIYALTRQKYDMHYSLHPDRPYKWRPKMS